MHDVLKKPLPEFAALGVSFFGITAALSGLCFTMVAAVSSESSVSTLRYAGENYFHASLLFIQVLVLVFVATSFAESWWAKQFAWLASAVNVVARSIASSLAITGFFCWYWAFDELNYLFWANWESQIALTKQREVVSSKPHED